jgi:hypothetical protein
MRAILAHPEAAAVVAVHHATTADVFWFSAHAHGSSVNDRPDRPRRRPLHRPQGQRAQAHRSRGRELLPQVPGWELAEDGHAPGEDVQVQGTTTARWRS